jgi:hypothetical protein
MHSFDIEKNTLSKDEWIDIYLSLENLDPLWRVYLNRAKGLEEEPKASDEEDIILSRLAAYFIYRYLPIAEDYEHMRAILAFCIHASEFIYTLYRSQDGDITLLDAALIYSAEVEYSEENIAALIAEFDTAFDF